MSEQENNDNRYVNSFTIKEKTFEDGNSILAVDINVKEFLAMLKDVKKNEKGYAKFRIVRRKTVSEWGHTHFMSKYEPKRNTEDEPEDDTEKSTASDKKAKSGKKDNTSSTKKKDKKNQSIISGGDDDVFN